MKIRISRLAFFTCLIALVIWITISYQQRVGDFAGYLTVGNLGLAGHDIYRDAPPGINTWPPFFGLFCIPIALLSKVSMVGARVFWMVLNWLALLVSLRIPIGMVYDKPLVMGGLSGSRTAGVDIMSGAALLPLLLTIRWSLSNFEHLQVNIIILALTLGGLWYHRNHRNVAAGFLIGAAAALKVMPVLFVPYFFWRRQWKAMAWTVIGTAGFSLAPVLVYGPGKFADQVSEWLGFFRRGQGVGKMNVSVYAMIDRILGHHLVPFAIPGFDNLAPSGSSIVNALLLVLLAAVTGLACWCFRGGYRPRDRSTVAEWSIVMLVGAIFSPLTWKFYLIVLLLPMTLFVGTWRDERIDEHFRSKLKWLTWIAYGIAMAAANVLVGNEIAYRLEMGSAITVSSLLILGTLFWYRARIDRVSRPDAANA